MSPVQISFAFISDPVWRILGPTSPGEILEGMLLPADVKVVGVGARWPAATRDSLFLHSLRVGASANSFFNAAGFPIEPNTVRGFPRVGLRAFARTTRSVTHLVLAAPRRPEPPCLSATQSAIADPENLPWPDVFIQW